MGSQHEEIVRVVGGHDSDGNDSGNASPEYTIDGGEVLEVDPTMTERDGELDYVSSSEESDDTYRDSLSSSIHQYIIENGRRYHSYFGLEKNPMPSDEIEQERLNMHHEAMLALLGGRLHLAPLNDPTSILDTGTGTGIWAIDMADKYPGAGVIGTDLCPIQPEWVPRNCKFEVDDAEQEWAYEPNSFDFIHIRNLTQAIGEWEGLLGEAYRCTKPGGYVELAEAGTEPFTDDNTMGEGFKKYHEVLDEAFRKVGRLPATGALLRQRLEVAGFVDIQVFSFKQPFGRWPKDQRMKTIGAMFLLICETGMEAYGMALFTRTLGLNPDEATKICNDGLAAARDMNNHMYTYL